MLEELEVDGYALIDKTSVAFSPGLNVLSGETGAGKSILIGAVGLILGRRGDVSVIRTGRDECTVTGVVRVAGHEEALNWLTARDIHPEDGEVILRRSVKTTGRGAIYIQSVPSTRADLKELTSLLFDVHGQHEHQSLLRVSTHRELLDRYAGIEADVSDFRELFNELTLKKRNLATMVEEERERLRERDIIAFALDEIEKADLHIGEDEQLEREAKVLSQHEQLFTELTDFHSECAENRGGALAGIRSGLSNLESAAGIDERLGEYRERLESALYEIEDIVDSVRKYQDEVDFSPQRLDVVEDRLAEIRRLEKKYGDGVEGVLDYARASREKLDVIENWEENKQELRDRISELEKAVWVAATELSKKRTAAAADLEKEIQSNLENLGMPDARFTIRMLRKEPADGKKTCGPHGIDNPEFLISPNKGEPAKPLREIASGGEMSRIMLAVKSVLADSDHIRSMIFDEIDAGIGGQVAVAVGQHLKALAERKQVLCITHLATIAVEAQTHVHLSKVESDGRTVTIARSIAGEQRVNEIARMLSGDTQDPTAISHAREMLERVGRRSQEPQR